MGYTQTDTERITRGCWYETGLKGPILTCYPFNSRRLQTSCSLQTTSTTRQKTGKPIFTRKTRETDTRLAVSFPGQPGWAATRNVKPIWILTKQEIIRWHWHQLDHMQIICTSVQTDNHARISLLNFFTCRMLFLMPNQQCQSTESTRSPEKSGLINPMRVCMTSDEHSSAEACQLHMVMADPPFPQIDIIGVMVIVWIVRGKIIRSVLCNTVYNNCAQCNAHTYEET